MVDVGVGVAGEAVGTEVGVEAGVLVAGGVGVGLDAVVVAVGVGLPPMTNVPELPSQVTPPLYSRTS